MAIQEFQVDDWLDSGRQLAIRYWNKLADINGNYQNDFDNLYFFVDDDNVKALDMTFACKRLQRKLKNVTSLEMKEQLNKFISNSKILFSSDSSIAELKQWLIDNDKVPDFSAIDDERSGMQQGDAASQAPTKSIVKSSIWSYINDAVMDIGDWLESVAEAAPDVLLVIFYVVVGLFLLIAVISVWVSDGLVGMIVALIVSAVIGYIAFWVGALVSLALRPLLWLVRYVFYNIYTLLSVVALILLVFFL